MTSQSSCTNLLSNLEPWSECRASGKPFREKTLLMIPAATSEAFWSLVGIASHHF